MLSNSFYVCFANKNYFLSCFSSRILRDWLGRFQNDHICQTTFAWISFSFSNDLLLSESGHLNYAHFSGLRLVASSQNSDFQDCCLHCYNNYRTAFCVRFQAWRPFCAPEFGFCFGLFGVVPFGFDQMSVVWSENESLWRRTVQVSETRKISWLILNWGPVCFRFPWLGFVIPFVFWFGDRERGILRPLGPYCEPNSDLV